MIRYFIFVCSLANFLAGPFLYARPSELLFHHLGNLNEDGINFVNDILFDSQDRVWLGGQTGFYRYDGEHYFAYRKTKDSNSIPDNFVHALCEDKQGNIWGGTEAGIFRFNPTTQQIKRYLTPYANADQGVNNICSDTNGKLWASTAFQLLCYSPQKDSFEVMVDLSSKNLLHTTNDIRKRGMLPSPDGKYLWLSTRRGLWAYNISEKKLLNSATQPENPFFTTVNTSALSAGTDGAFLYFDNTHKDIVKFDPVKMTIVKKISIGDKIPDAVGATLFEDREGHIWFCSWSNLVLMIDQKDNNRIYNLNGKLNEPLGLLSNYFWQARQDKDGSVWLATPEGVFVTNEPKNLFTIHRIHKKIKELQPNIFINVFAENRTDKTWWMTTSGNTGIFFLNPEGNNKQPKRAENLNMIIHYEPATGQYEILNPDVAPADKQGRKPAAIHSISFYKNNPVLISNNGAWLYLSSTKQWQPFETAIGLTIPFTIRMMAGDEEKGYYISDGEQLAYFNNIQKTIKTIIPDSGKNINPVYNLYPRQNHKPQLYGSFGLSGMLKLQHDTAYVIPLLKNSRIENIGYIDDIDVDSRGQVWVSFKNVGLFCYNPATGAIRNWDESDGLAINGIHNITIDQRDNIWTIHRRQFSVLLAGTNRFFNVAMPISNTILNWSNNLITLTNGHVVANNFNDVVEFFPDRLLQQPVSRLPEISSLYINEKPYNFQYGNPLRLSPNENSLQFRFGILTNKNYFPYDLEYMLEGAEKNWQKAGVNAEAFYNKLAPGHYTFKVRAVAKNGSWTSAEQTINIQIGKPLYLQAWFILIMLLLISGIILAIARYRLQKQKQILTLESKAASLEKEKAMIQYESLKQHLNPHFLFNSLTSLRSLIKTDSKTAAWFLDGLSKVYRYVLKSAEKELVLLKEETDFVKTFGEMQKVRFGKGLEIIVNIDDKAGDRYIAPVVLQNLVENAIKHNTTSTDEPLVVEIFTESDFITVRNNLQRYRVVETSNKQGLESLCKLYSFYTERPIIIEEDEQYFVVSIPLL
jgi:ligand-binding sensor domain-containing protein/sensor histidine kinase YesM